MALIDMLIDFSFASSAAASFLFLDKKVTKNQGLDLMSVKLVETLLATAD
ncbi:hypothetical protein [Pedobacter agri]|nr:hypothetical protein [Pedobacter agri]